MMPSWISVVLSTRRSPTSRARASSWSARLCAPVVVALELERARPVQERRERGPLLAGSLGQRHGALGRLDGARVVAGDERERGAKTGRAGAPAVVVEHLGQRLERLDVGALLGAPARFRVDAAARQEQREAGRRVGLGNESPGRGR